MTRLACLRKEEGSDLTLRPSGTFSGGLVGVVDQSASFTGWRGGAEGLRPLVGWRRRHESFGVQLELGRLFGSGQGEEAEKEGIASGLAIWANREHRRQELENREGQCCW